MRIELALEGPEAAKRLLEASGLGQAAREQIRWPMEQEDSLESLAREVYLSGVIGPYRMREAIVEFPR